MLIMQSDYIYPPGEKYGRLLVHFKGEGKEHVNVERMEVKPGLSLAIMSIDTNEVEGFQFEALNSPFEFSYCVKGSCYIGFKDSKFKKNSEITGRPGMNIISRTDTVIGNFEVVDKSCYKAVGLHIDPNFLTSFLDESKINSQPEVFFRKNQKNYFVSQSMSFKMAQLVSQIINCELEGRFKELFIESKAIELFLHQMESIPDCGLIMPTDLSSDDIEKIYEAKNILIKNIDNPPGITTLAKLSGINEFKLKKGFKQVFGTTVYGFLKSWRMAYAKELILDGNTSVNDLAYSTGYSNVSHFISGFKNEFGETPGQFIKKTHF